MFLQEAGGIDLFLIAVVAVGHHLGQRLVKAQACDALGAKLGLAAVRPLDGDLVVTKILVFEHLAGDADRVTISVQLAFYIATGEIGVGDFFNMLGDKFAVLVSQVLAQFAIEQAGIDQLYLALT